MNDLYIRFAQLIRHDTRLSPLARLIYCDFADLCTDDGAVMISNTYLSKIYDVLDYTICLALGELKDFNIISLKSINQKVVRHRDLINRQDIIKYRVSRIIYLNKDAEQIFGIKEKDLYETWQ